MKSWAVIGAFSMLLVTQDAGAATCESVRTDLVGQNIYGQHTMLELSQETSAGNCGAAAYLSRRAKDAQGFLAINCPADVDMLETAGRMLKLGQRVLETPACQN